MKVLHFLGLGQVPKKPLIDTTGGIERVALEIARLQAKRGAEVTVAVMAPTAWRGTWEGVNLRHLRPYSWAKFSYRGSVRDFRTHLSLSKYILLKRFDLVHLHEYRRTRFIEKLPKVMHFHNDPFDRVPVDSTDQAAAHYWTELGKAKAQIAVSTFVGRRLEILHQRAGAAAPTPNIVVNQSGVDANMLPREQWQEARERTRRELGLKESDVLYLFAGAVRSEKGVIQLAQAFSKLAEKHKNAYLAVVGGKKLWVDDDPPTETAELQIREILGNMAAEKRALFLGILPSAALPSHYAAADVFVLPSMFQESFGLVILEAFAAAIPVIGARSGAIPELIEDDHNGLLVNQGDVDGLLDAMRRLLLDRALRERLGAAGRQTALRMPWENTVDRLERVYQGILASN